MSVLRNTQFLKLLVAQSFASFGTTALYLSLGIWAKELTGSDAAAGSVFLALGVPALVAPLAGNLVDRGRRRRLLLVACALMGLSTLLLLLVRTPDQLWLIYVVATVYGLLGNVLSPAQSALVRDMVPDESLASANASLQTVSQGLRLLSPLVGAGLYAAFGGWSLVVLNVGCFAVAVLVLLMTRIAESSAPEATVSWREDVPAGFRHILRVPLLLQITAAAAVSFCVVGLSDTADFAVVDQGLHQPPPFFGVLMSVQGGGAIVGGMTAALVMNRWGIARAMGSALTGLAIGALLSTSSAMAVVLAGAAVAGLAIPWLFVSMFTALQTYTPRHLQGRVSAAANMVIVVPQTASIALGTALITFVDYRVLLLAITTVTLACGVALLARPAPIPIGADSEADRVGS